MQDACYMNFVIDLVTVKSLWLSSRALDRGIWRSEVGFLMGTQNFFFVPRLWQDEKHLSLKHTMFQLSMGLPMRYTIFFDQSGCSWCISDFTNIFSVLTMNVAVKGYLILPIFFSRISMEGHSGRQNFNILWCWRNCW